MIDPFLITEDVMAVVITGCGRPCNDKGVLQTPRTGKVSAEGRRVGEQ